MDDFPINVYTFVTSAWGEAVVPTAVGISAVFAFFKVVLEKRKLSMEIAKLQRGETEVDARIYRPTTAEISTYGTTKLVTSRSVRQIIRISVLLLPIVTPVFFSIAIRESEPQPTATVDTPTSGQAGQQDQHATDTPASEPYWFFDFDDTPLDVADFDRCRLTSQGGSGLVGRCTRGPEELGRSTFYLVYGTARAPQLRWTVSNSAKPLLEMKGTLSETADTIRGTWRSADRKANGTFVARLQRRQQ